MSLCGQKTFEISNGNSFRLYLDRNDYLKLDVNYKKKIEITQKTKNNVSRALSCIIACMKTWGRFMEKTALRDILDIIIELND